MVLTIAGGAVSWSSKLQSVVLHSTTEAEFIAASETGHELCWMRNFLDEIGSPQIGPSELQMDNQSTISICLCTSSGGSVEVILCTVPTLVISSHNPILGFPFETQCLRMPVSSP